MFILNTMYAIFKSKTFVFLTFIFLLSVAFPTLAELSSADKEALQQQVTEIRVAVNRGDPDIIAPLLSPNAPAELRDEIDEAIRGKNIYFQQEITRFEELENGRVKVHGTFSAEGLNWNITGLWNWYIFEEQEGNWLLVDTNFHEQMSFPAVLKLVMIIIAVIFPFTFGLLGFWIWMLIDVSERNFKDKTLWILLIVFLGIIGALIYFFAVRPKLKKADARPSSTQTPNTHDSWEKAQNELAPPRIMKAVEYYRTYQSGHTIKEIEDALVQQGYTKEEIDDIRKRV